MRHGGNQDRTIPGKIGNLVRKYRTVHPSESALPFAPQERMSHKSRAYFTNLAFEPLSKPRVGIQDSSS